MKAVFSLTEDGYITDSAKMLEYLVSYYILSDSAQSISFQGSIINLPETYYLFINDPAGMASRVRTDLERLLSSYYPVVEIQTDAKKIDQTNKFGISLYVAAIDEEGKRVELSKVVEISTTGLRKIINVNNYGDALSYLKLA